MGKPFISVVVTAYNRREFLKYAVKSVINQTLDKGLYEMIVVKNFKDLEIDHLIENNRGKIIDAGDESIGKYLTRGINESEGEVIAFLDDDDVYHSRKLELLLKVFNKNEELDYYHHNIIPINEKGDIIAAETDNIYEYITIRSNDYNTILNLIKKYNFGMGSYMSTIALRKSLASMLAKYLLPHVIYAPDSVTYAFALRYGRLLVHEPHYLTYYRIHGKNVSRKFEDDLKRISKVGALTIVAVRYQIPIILTFNVEDIKIKETLKKIAEKAIKITYTDIVSSIVMDWRYNIVKYSFKGLLTGIKDASIYRIAAAIIGFIYLIDPYVTKKLIQWWYF